MTPQGDMDSLFLKPDGRRIFLEWYDGMLGRLDVPWEARYVRTRQGNTHVVTCGAGDGPDVVLLPGLGTTGVGMPAVLGQAGRRCRLHVVDVIGQPGKSAHSRPDPAGPGYGQWVADVLDGLGIAKARIVAFSFGSWLTLALASQAPDRIERAALAIPAGLVPMTNDARLVLVHQWLRATALRDPDASRALNRALAAPGHEPMEDLVRMTEITARSFAPEIRPLWPFDFPGTSPVRVYHREELARFTAPTLVVAGLHDRLFPFESLARQAARVLPGLVEVRVDPYLGHVPSMDCFDRTVDRILTFVCG